MYTFIELSNGKQFIIKDHKSFSYPLSSVHIYDYKEIFTPNGASIMVTRLDDKKINPVYPKDNVNINAAHIIYSYEINESSPIITDAIKKADASVSGLIV